MAPAVKLISDSVLRPYRSPSSSRHPLHDARIPLTPFDMANYNCHVCILYAFHSPMPDDATLRQSLAGALAHFPHLAGRFVHDEHGYTHVVLNDAGIRLKEATASTALNDHLPFDPSASYLNLHPHPAEGTEVLLQIQLTRFICGGVTLGITSHHRIADGISFCHFLFAWARLSRGFDAGVSPFLDWYTVCSPRDPISCEFDHLGVEYRLRAPRPPVDVLANLSKLQNISVHFSKEFIAEIKQKVTEDDSTKRASTFLSVLTHIWKKTTLARGLHYDQVSKVRLAVNGRQRIVNPPVPSEYFGNLILWAFPAIKAGELLKGSYAHVAQVIRDAVNKVNDLYFKSFIDFGELLKGEKGTELEATLPAVGESLSPDIEFNSWLNLSFHELDFGGGTPCSFFPPGLPVEGLMILVPSCGKTGGVDVYMALEKAHVSKFTQVIYSLD